MNEQYVIDFLTGKLPYTMELTILCQAFTGAMAVRGGRNKYGQLHWFHAFVLSAMTGFSGGLFNFLWMGKPTSMISNDVVFASVVIAFVSVNYVPFFFQFVSLLPVKMVITAWAMLFRSLGLCSFTSNAFNAFKDSPSKYYPVPVFGPIWYGVMLGNMGGFALKGVDGHLSGGVPWPFQNGMFCGPFFLFYALDDKGPIGEIVRSTIAPLHDFLPDLDHRGFAVFCVGLFMQVIAILQLPLFFGPSFSPFVLVHKVVNSPLEAALSKEKSIEMQVKNIESTQSKQDDDSGVIKQQSTPAKGKKNKKGKKKKA
ncbi:expressed unknown protein [Seminavis robusta]|uniref:Uncharacterized protein n=1 Tax=Seminavis robusta TaxID=568900 RepID=A0A9N8H5K7_9STRA|nr:expressed unknown protein [Seminavis robusta]|eukprot:Sro88_g046720.1 n/a (312) ;mRNA; r:112287-113307